MTITFEVGDLLASDEEVLAHGCNTIGVMGAGIAKQIKERHPLAFEVYQQACERKSFRVGTAQPVWVAGEHRPISVGEAEPVWATPGRLVYNLGTQRNPGADATTWGIFLSFANMTEDAYNRGITRVAIPRIGAGIGGLSWDTDVQPAIEEAMSRASRPLEIVVYDLPRRSET